MRRGLARGVERDSISICTRRSLFIKGKGKGKRNDKEKEREREKSSKPCEKDVL